MKKWKPVVAVLAVVFIVTLIVPALLVLPFDQEKVKGAIGEAIPGPPAQESPPTEVQAVEVAVYRTGRQAVEKIPLEEYVVGVVASEMPADFEKEALKAQALTARTYILKQMISEEKMKLPQDAVVADTEFYQVYKSPDELKKLWGSDYNWKLERITEAAQATAGQILTFNGTPIDATFFSTSNGFTENSEAIWTNSLPYLKSVESPWDKSSPKFKGQAIFAVKDFEAKLGVKVSGNETIGKITEYTAGKRVAKVDFSGKVLTGKEIREKLGLKSTDFTWERKGDRIIVNTEGYGHGVGMSQYGANGMAKEGKKYSEIVTHYYQGVQISSTENLMATITAKK